MMEYTRKLGKRGQVTIPKDVRRRMGLEEGDEVEVVETDNGVLITPPVDKNDLAAGYRARSDRSVELMQEMEPSTAEANERLGDAPAWESSE